MAQQPDRLPPLAPDAQCAVNGCEKFARGGGRGWCGGHYERWRLSGDVRANVPLKRQSPGRRYAPDATCAVEDCERSLKRGGEGWCQKHFERWKKHGDPLIARVPPPDERDAFESRVDRSGGPDACHAWNGRINPDGYGWAKANGRYTLAHIAAWEFEKGPRKPGIELDHECHNQAVRDGVCSPGKCAHRLCCNPRHLIPRTRSEHRAVTAWHGTVRLGEANNMAKLTEQQVRELRTLLKDAHGNGMAEIAGRYGIGRTQAYRIKNGKAWKWLPDAA